METIKQIFLRINIITVTLKEKNNSHIKTTTTSTTTYLRLEVEVFLVERVDLKVEFVAALKKLVFRRLSLIQFVQSFLQLIGNGVKSFTTGRGRSFFVHKLL